MRADAHQPPPRLHVEGLVREACAEIGVAFTEVVGSSKRSSAGIARHRVWKRLLDEGYSHAAIARGWGCSNSAVHNAMKPKLGRAVSRGLRAPSDAKLAAGMLSAWPSIDAALAPRERPARPA